MNQPHPTNGGLDWNFENWKPDWLLGHCRHVPPAITNVFCDLSGQIFPPGNNGLVGVGVTFT